jgi:hypothetical protein
MIAQTKPSPVSYNGRRLFMSSEMDGGELVSYRFVDARHAHTAFNTYQLLLALLGPASGPQANRTLGNLAQSRHECGAGLHPTNVIARSF